MIEDKSKERGREGSREEVLQARLRAIVTAGRADGRRQLEFIQFIFFFLFGRENGTMGQYKMLIVCARKGRRETKSVGRQAGKQANKRVCSRRIVY